MELTTRDTQYDFVGGPREGRRVMPWGIHVLNYPDSAYHLIAGRFVVMPKDAAPVRWGEPYVCPYCAEVGPVQTAAVSYVKSAT